MTAETLTVALLLLFCQQAAALASEKQDNVYFLHNAENTLKMGCAVQTGEENAAAPRYTYTCPDEQENMQPFQPGDQWRLMEVNRVCFLDRVRDIIRVCAEISDPQDVSRISYACAVGDSSPKPFTPTRKWEKLSAEDKRCAPRMRSFVVPDGAVIPTIPDVRGADEPGK